MPTAARLFAAIGFALVAYFAAESYILELPEGTQKGLFSEITAGLGAIAGWRVMGSNVGRGTGVALTTGFRTTAVFTFFTLVGFSIYEMVSLSMKLRYSGPGEALQGLFDLIYDYGIVLFTSPPVLAILLVGGSLAALLSEWAGSRWR